MTRARKRIRRAEPIDHYGLTAHNHYVWRIGSTPMHETHIDAIIAAANQVRNTADGQTLLNGEVVNECDLTALLSGVKAALESGERICFVCFRAPVERAGMCFHDWQIDAAGEDR